MLGNIQSKEDTVCVTNVKMYDASCRLYSYANIWPASCARSVKSTTFPSFIRLTAIQKLSIEVVNNAYNELLIKEQNYKTLHDSIDSFDNFKITLAQWLEKYDLLEFRWFTAHILQEKLTMRRVNISLKVYKDAIITAAASAFTEVAEDLISYFVDIGNKECMSMLILHSQAEFGLQNGGCQIKTSNSLEDVHIREIYKACLKQHGRLNQEVPQVGETIESAEDLLEVTEAITSHS
ncbi:hypothetical protein V8E55_007344 [Tylopilus felleus]